MRAVLVVVALAAIGTGFATRFFLERAPTMIGSPRGPRAAKISAPVQHSEMIPTKADARDTRVEATSRMDPDRAVTLALQQPAEKRLAAASAVLIDAAGDPALATRLARRFCREDPAFVREHGATLITVLAAAGEFRAAATFAELGGPERAAWMRAAFQRWAKAEPEAAQRAADELDDDDARAGAAEGAGAATVE